jgi:hypothetical protein
MMQSFTTNSKKASKVSQTFGIFHASKQLV